MTNSEYREYLQSDKWKAIAQRRLEIDDFKCVCCGSRGTTGSPLEIHHLSYKHLGNEQDRIYQDLCTVCHICHRQIHRLMSRQTDPSGRRGWKDASYTPDISVYTITGQELLVKD